MSFAARLFFIFYCLITTLIAPLGLAFLCYKKRHDPPYGSRVGELLGRYRHKKSRSSSIWFHTVSVGEAIAARPLIRTFIAQHPDLHVIVTTTTTTGAAEIEKITGAHHVYAPLDCPLAVYSFLKKFNPSHLFIMETELWPCLLNLSSALGVRIAIFNARMPEKTCKKYCRYPRLTQDLISKRIDLVISQSADDQERFARIGIPAHKLVTTGSLKYDLTPNEELFHQALHYKQQWAQKILAPQNAPQSAPQNAPQRAVQNAPQRAVQSETTSDPQSAPQSASTSTPQRATSAYGDSHALPPASEITLSQVNTMSHQELAVLGALSIHAGEEELIIESFYSLKVNYPNLRLVLVPRHQTDTIKALNFLQSIKSTFQLRTETKPDLSDFTSDILIGNTMGEMEFYLGLCDMVFMGGSFVDVGGHNPLEPAYFSLPIITGPYYYNFAEQYDALIEQGGTLVANDHHRFVTVCQMFLDDKEKRTSVGMQAFEVQQLGCGSIKRTLAQLDRLLN